MINKLESLLSEITAFNHDAEKLNSTGGFLLGLREAIIGRAKELGITRPNASGMLAKIKCDVAMPGTEGSAAGDEGSSEKADGKGGPGGEEDEN